MQLNDALTQLGLSNDEIQVYLASLELGESLIYPLAKHAGVKRPTLYNLLPRLHDLGLISYGSKGKRRTVVGQDPSKLITVQEEKLKDVRAVLPELLSHYNRVNNKTKTYTYEGVEGIKQIYEDTLIDEFPILSFLQVEEINPEVKDYLLSSYVPRRIKRGIRVKNLVSGDKAESEKILPDTSTYRENRYVNQKLFPAGIEVMMYSNKVAYITYGIDSEPGGVVIENSAAAETMRSLHKMGWELAGKE